MHTQLGYARLNPLQEKSLADGLLSNERVVVSAPTASGKTLLALMKILDNFKRNHTKSVYIVPLRALAGEKFDQFSEKLGPHGLKVGLSTGDLDSSSEQLSQFDVVIVTSEKMDSLLRHGPKWIEQIGLVVADEVHLLGDGTRGATLEIVLTKLFRRNCGFLCLSATIPNAVEISDWLEAKLIQSDYRPTPLFLGVFDGEKLEVLDKKTKLGGLKELVLHALAEKPVSQVLVFSATRRGTESFARELSLSVPKFLTEAEREECAWLAEKALKALGTPTSQCKILAECMKNGIAFHHAGLPSKQRQLIELGFKKHRCLKAIVCTTTLAVGIDYPASWVVVKDLKRFNGAFAELIPALECAQMVGRAGRPDYDARGIGVLCCGAAEKTKIREKYFFGPLEKIQSQLSSEPVLRSHVLALVASEYCRDFKTLYGFFEKTFFAFQYADLEELYALVEKVVGDLKDMDFVREKGGLLLATPLGKRVSELYIDPLSAYAFSEFARKGRENVFDYLMALQEATESKPYLSVKQNEEVQLWDELYAIADDSNIAQLEGDFNALEKFKTAKVLNAWINEATEAKVLEDFDLPPGSMHSRVINSEWLCYALSEIAFLLNQTRAYGIAKRLTRRIKNGVKDELLDLCRIRGIGRARARKLFNRGIVGLTEFRAADKDEIKRIVRE